MEIDGIITSLDFKEFVCDLVRNNSLSKRTMGEYLRALWGQILEYKDDIVTYAQLAHLLETAYVVEPLPFDREWLNVKRLGWTWDRSLGTYITKGYDENTKKWVITERDVDPFRILKHTILAQISERYVLENAPERVPEEHRKCLENDWSNPDPYPYLEAAMYALYDEAEKQTTEHVSDHLDWAELAAILSIGQVYD